MAVFCYQAIDNKGRNVKGVMSAQSEPDLEEKIKASGMWLLEATMEAPPTASAKAVARKESWTAFGKVPRRELIEFCTLMSFQCRVGIPLLQSLEQAGQDCQYPRFKRVIGGMQQHIESGLLFYESLEKFPGTFSAHFVSIVRAGELSSKLPEAFTDLKEYLEWVEQVLADVRQASLYPAITLAVVSGFGLFLFTFIIPKFVILLEGLKVPIPLLTRIIFGVSDFAKATWWVWVLVLIFLMIGIPIGRRMSKRFAYAVDYVKIHLPIFGELNLMLAMSRFAHNLSILYSSGISIIQALTLCQGLIDCVPVEQAVSSVETDVKAGNTVSEAMRKHKIFPPILLRMVTMGEGTGSLDKSLQNVSDYYNEIIPRRIKKVFSFLEPAMTLMLIFMVGAIALSIYLPLISVMSAIGK